MSQGWRELQMHPGLPSSQDSLARSVQLYGYWIGLETPLEFLESSALLLLVPLRAVKETTSAYVCTKYACVLA